jgi:translation elongation factor EF-G
MTSDATRMFFRETIQGQGRGEMKIARRRGMRNEYAHVLVSVRPAERGRGVILEWNAGANIPAFFSLSVLRGIQDALQTGVTGLEVTDITVSVETGSYHDVNSNEAVFREMAHKAILQAIEQAGSVILEAMSLVLLTVPANQIEVAEIAVARLGGEATPAVKKEDGSKTLAAIMSSATVDELIEELLGATRGSAKITSRSNGYRPRLDLQGSAGPADPVVQPTQK